MLRFNREQLRPRIERLDYRAKIAFAVCICERLYPNYVSFYEQEDWGNPATLRNCLDTLRQAISGKAPIKEKLIRSYLNAVREITPDTQQYSSLHTSSALDAACAISEALEFIIDRKVERLLDIASMAIDTVDMYIQQRDSLNFDDPLFVETILTDPLMQRELMTQLQDIDNLLEHTASGENATLAYCDACCARGSNLK